jgi:glycosyltransferase involved in cell wall biosynthesis
MDISIVTPSFNMLAYLKRCCASVADQHSSEFEHIVVDGGSTDGTAEWLRSRPRIHSIVEPDRGMYDAINKGLRVARGEVLAYLNCDEQYLPGTLSFVAHYFEQHPSVDILFGDTFLVRADGTLLCVQKTYKPFWPLILSSHLYLYSASMFLRRRLVEAGEYFDPWFRGGGDFEFVPRVLRKGYRAATVRRPLSTFTMTGENHSMTAGAELARDWERIRPTIPWWVRRFAFPLKVARLSLKALSGAYQPIGPVQYAIYASEDQPQRQLFWSPRASARWRTA